MIAIDTNILLYAHRCASPWYQAAASLLTDLAEGNKPWGIPWPCLHEFVAISTHPKVFLPPSTLEESLEQLKAWCASPVISLLSEEGSFWDSWEKLLFEGRIAGPMAHDAKIAAICLSHGVTVLYSLDRDFSRFPRLKVHNPLPLVSG